MAWQENLMSEDMPPAWMWPLPDVLEEWFDEVAARHKARYGGDSDRDEDVPMMQNDLAAGRR